MKSTWLSAVLVGGVLLLSLSACGDSSDVGLGVGPGHGGEQPKTIDATPSSLDTTRRVPLTGRVVSSLTPGGSPSWRFLVGRVDDPLPGTGVLKANGYFDVSLPPTLPDTIANEEVPDSINAHLRLPRTYLHGYTSDDTSDTEVNIEVLNLTGDPKVDTLRADATLDVDGTSATDGAVAVPLADTMVIDLPSSWLTEKRLKDLRKADGEADSLNQVHGFKLTSPNTETAVVGFSTNSAELRLTHKSVPEDTLFASYTSFKSFTHIEQVEPPMDSLSSHKVIQGGTGIGLEMTWDFNASPLDTLRNDPLNAAQIFVPVDTLEMDRRTDDSFARPLPKGYRMFARQSSGASPLRMRPTAAPEAAQVSNDLALRLLRESLRRAKNDQDPVADTLRAFVADRESFPTNRRTTLNPGLPSTVPVLIPVDVDNSAPYEPGPRFTLTVSPL